MKKVVSLFLVFIMAFSSITYVSATETYSSELPVVYIDTQNGDPIVTKDYYINANLRITGTTTHPALGTKAKDYNDTANKTEIKGRGNSTWPLPKKPFKLKLDKAADLFGMGSNKHWVLLANYTDQSLMRNTISYDLSGQMGLTNMQTVWVDVVLNGEYQGNYQLCEHIRVDAGSGGNRVDITNFDDIAKDISKAIGKGNAANPALSKTEISNLETALAENFSWVTTDQIEFTLTSGEKKTYKISDFYTDDVTPSTGGYLLELDGYYDEISKFKTLDAQPIMINTPEFAKTNTEMMSYIGGFVQAFEDATKTPNFKTTYNGVEVGYEDLFDMDSLAKYWLVQEIFFNEEVNKKSTWMYKKPDVNGTIGKIFMGPVWDMDWSSNGEGKTSYFDQWGTNFFNDKAQAQQWYKQLVKDPKFIQKVFDEYRKIRPYLGDIIKVDGIIDTSKTYLNNSAANNAAAWYKKPTFDASVNKFKTWLTNRINWLDAQFVSTSALSLSLTGTAIVTMEKQIVAAPDIVEDTISPANNLADKMVENGASITVNFSGIASNVTKAEVYINDKLFAPAVITNNATAVTIDNASLSSDNFTQDMIELRVYNEKNNIIGAEYVHIINYVKYKKGDLDNNNTIDLLDSLRALKVATTVLNVGTDFPTKFNPTVEASDYNDDKTVDATDVQSILSSIL